MKIRRKAFHFPCFGGNSESYFLTEILKFKFRFSVKSFLLLGQKTLQNTKVKKTFHMKLMKT